MKKWVFAMLLLAFLGYHLTSFSESNSQFRVQVDYPYIDDTKTVVLYKGDSSYSSKYIYDPKQVKMLINLTIFNENKTEYWISYEVTNIWNNDYRGSGTSISATNPDRKSSMQIPVYPNVFDKEFLYADYSVSVSIYRGSYPEKDLESTINFTILYEDITVCNAPAIEFDNKTYDINFGVSGKIWYDNPEELKAVFTDRSGKSYELSTENGLLLLQSDGMFYCLDVPQGDYDVAIKMKKDGMWSRPSSHSLSVRALSYVYDDSPDFVLPSGLKEIDEEAFAGLGTREMYIILPDGLLQIGARAFADYSKQLSIYIPDSVTDIHDRAFDGTNVLILAHEGSAAIQFAKRKNYNYYVVNEGFPNN